MYSDYCEAISLAVDYTREQKGDPDFSLGIDPFADVSTPSHKKATPKQADSSTTNSLASHSTASQTRKSTSTKNRANSTGRKRPEISSAPPASKKGGNSRTISASAASPLLSDAFKTTSEEIKSSGRKRGRDSVATQMDDKTLSESGVKRQRRNSDGSPSWSMEQEKSNEAIPRKLNFNDDDPEGNASPEGDSSIKRPMAKTFSSRCGGPLTNGHTNGLLSSEGKKNPPESDSIVSGLVEAVTDQEKQMGVEKTEVAALPTRSRDDNDSADDDETMEGGGFSDSDDDSMPAFNCSVVEDLTGTQCTMETIKAKSSFPYRCTCS